MSKKKQEKNTQRRRITFKLEAPEANEAILAGDFNSWDLKKHTMKKGGGPRLSLSHLEDTSISFSSMGNGRMIPTMIEWSITPLGRSTIT